MPLPSRQLAEIMFVFCLVTFAVGALLFSRSSLVKEITLSSKSSPDKEQYVFASRGRSRNSQQQHSVSGGSSRILRSTDPYEESGHIPREKGGKRGTRALASLKRLARQATTVERSSSPRQAKLAFLVLSDGNDIERMRAMLPAIYHPDNIYLVHVDAKSPPAKVSLSGILCKLVASRWRPKPPRCGDDFSVSFNVSNRIRALYQYPQKYLLAHLAWGHAEDMQGSR